MIHRLVLTKFNKTKTIKSKWSDTRTGLKMSGGK